MAGAKDGIPAIPPVPPSADPALRAFLESLRQATIVRFGQSNNQLDRSPTLRELIADGIVAVTGYSSGVPSGYGPGGGTGGGTNDPFNDPRQPGAPVNLVATPTPMNIILTWNEPTGLTAQIAAFAEVWANSVDNRATATMIGTGYVAYVHSVEPMTTTYYWVRYRSYANVPGPFNAINGVVGTTPQSPANLLALLEGALSESELTTTLNERIDEIDTPTTGILDRLAAEIGTREGNDDDLQTQINAIAEGTAATVFVQDGEPVPGVSGVPDPIPAGSRWYDSNDNNHPYIYDSGWISIVDGRIGENASDIVALEATVNDATTGVDATAAALAVLDATVVTLDGEVTANTADITSLEATVNHGTTGVAANATAIGALDTRVTTAEGEIDTNASDITALEATVNNGTTGVAATAAGLAALDVRVTENEGDILASAADIVALVATVDDPVSGVDVTASAVSALDVRVTSVEGVNTSQADSISSLSSTVGSNTATIATQASSINGIQAKYSVKVDVNGHVSGFGLISTTNDGTPLSEFQVAVDRFSIRSPGSTSLVFGVAGGSVVMNAAFIQDATITNAKIASLAADKITAGNITVALGLTSGSINITSTGRIYGGKTAYGSATAGVFLGMSSGVPTFDVGNSSQYMRWNGSSLAIGGNIIATGNIVANGVTSMTSAYTAGSTSTANHSTWNTIQSVGVTSTGGPHTIDFSFMVSDPVGWGKSFYIRVLRNATVIFTTDGTPNPLFLAASDSKAVAMSTQDQPAAGANTYYLQIYKAGSGGLHTLDFQTRYLRSLELKR